MNATKKIFERIKGRQEEKHLHHSEWQPQQNGFGFTKIRHIKDEREEELLATERRKTVSICFDPVIVGCRLISDASMFTVMPERGGKS